MFTDAENQLLMQRNQARKEAESLRAINAELVAALQLCAMVIDAKDSPWAMANRGRAFDLARAALAKAGISS